MNQNICIEKTTFIAMLIIILLVSWFFHDKMKSNKIIKSYQKIHIGDHQKNELSETPPKLKKSIDESSKNQHKLIETIDKYVNHKAHYLSADEQNRQESPLPIIRSSPIHDLVNDQIVNDQIINDQTLTMRDVRASSDPFYPPWRRMPRHQYPPLSVRRVLNVPSRGYTDNFQFLGNLVRKTDEKVVQLYGREEYPGSNKWEYYGHTNDSNGIQMKFKIENKRSEFYDGDEVILPMLDLSKGKFKLHMNEFDIPRYDPYLI